MNKVFCLQLKFQANTNCNCLYLVCNHITPNSRVKINQVAGFIMVFKALNKEGYLG
jgi:hypothetical protein